MANFNDIQNHRQEIKDNILKSFGVDIEKGVYVDNSENRKLGRVGRSYGNQGSTHRKGDLVSVVGPTGMRATGKIVSMDGDTVRIHIKGNEYFSGKVTDNSSAKQREKENAQKEEERKAEKRYELKRQLRILDKQEERVRLDQDQDSEVLANIEDGNHPAVKRYSRMLEQIDRKRDSIRGQLEKLK